MGTVRAPLARRRPTLGSVARRGGTALVGVLGGAPVCPAESSRVRHSGKRVERFRHVLLHPQNRAFRPLYIVSEEQVGPRPSRGQRSTSPREWPARSPLRSPAAHAVDALPAPHAPHAP